MNLNKKKIVLCLLILVLTAVLASCGGGATPEPTQDMAVFATNAAQTIEAQFTETALAQPTDTPEPTYTPVSFTPTAASAAQLPTTGAAAVPTITPAGQIAAAGGVTNDPTTAGAAAGAAAPTATLATAGDKATYDSQNPVDGTHYSPGQSFDITWYLLNSGTTTWTTDYCLRFYVGTNFGKPGKDRYYLNSAVAPNTVGAVSMDAVAPTTSGTYQMAVVLGNEMEQNFMMVDVTIIVD